MYDLFLKCILQLSIIYRSISVCVGAGGVSAEVLCYHQIVNYSDTICNNCVQNLLSSLGFL